MSLSEAPLQLLPHCCAGRSPPELPPTTMLPSTWSMATEEALVVCVDLSCLDQMGTPCEDIFCTTVLVLRPEMPGNMSFV